MTSTMESIGRRISNPSCEPGGLSRKQKSPMPLNRIQADAYTALRYTKTSPECFVSGVAGQWQSLDAVAQAQGRLIKLLAIFEGISRRLLFRHLRQRVIPRYVDCSLTTAITCN